jgi:hypothetical protein
MEKQASRLWIGVSCTADAHVCMECPVHTTDRSVAVRLNALNLPASLFSETCVFGGALAMARAWILPNDVLTPRAGGAVLTRLVAVEKMGNTVKDVFEHCGTYGEDKISLTAFWKNLEVWKALNEQKTSLDNALVCQVLARLEKDKGGDEEISPADFAGGVTDFIKDMRKEEEARSLDYVDARSHYVYPNAWYSVFQGRKVSVIEHDQVVPSPYMKDDFQSSVWTARARLLFFPLLLCIGWNGSEYLACLGFLFFCGVLSLSGKGLGLGTLFKHFMQRAAI